MRISFAAKATCALSILSLGGVYARSQEPVRPGIPPIRPGLPDRIRPGQLKPIPAADKLWGFADLHAHPASHMSFGANERGDGGIFWGKPGMGADSGTATILGDMPPCATDSHYGFDEDPVRKGTRRTVITMLDALYGASHGPNGSPSFRDWPHSQSLVHQQMHISAIKRAYDGGLRLMVASTTDAQMLSNLWTKVGFNLFGNSVPAVDPNFDFNSAKRQLDFLHRQAAANSRWMRIVMSPAEARQAIKENKLAVILSVEMDSLTPDQVLNLINNHKVRHVVPIHLANGPFGGAAAYSDVFNSSSGYLNGSFMRVVSDPLLEFRLGRPQRLEPSRNAAERGAIVPYEIADAEYRTLGYETGAGGHKNAQGLNTPAVERLMRAGVIVDVAHMGERSMEDALRLAERYKYPLMNSHTGIRGPGERSHSERDMKRSHALRLTRLGGVIGFGTEGTQGDRVLLEASGGPLFRFTGSAHDWSRPLPTAGPRAGNIIHNIRAIIGTGGDDLRGGNDNADIVLTLRSGRKLTFKNVNKSQSWGGGVRKTVFLPIPPGTRTGDLVSFSVVTAFGGGLFGDNWDMANVKLMATEQVEDSVGAWVKDYLDAVAVTGGQPIALGTDMNGFAPQVPFSSGTIAYPIRVASRAGSRPAGFTPPALDRYRAGSKSYHFPTDGLAHYGMLPDFMQMMTGKANGQRALDSLYSSADAVVRMWEASEAARARM